MASSCGDEEDCLGPLCAHLAKLVCSWKEETWSCKEARHEMHDKDGMYNEAAMEELIILLYKKI